MKLLRKLLSFFRYHSTFTVLIISFLATCIYFFPLFQGLILLPLDLLVANHGPWYYQSSLFVKNTFMEDSIVQMYPWRYFVFDSLSNGVIPFWNPYTFMGTPFLASMKPMVFYPFTLILFKLGPVYGWNLLLFLQVFLSLFFTYLFLRDWKISPLVSFFGSLVYSLNTLMMAVLEFGSEGHVLLWLPLMLYASKRFIDGKSSWFLFLLGISIASSFLAGQPQYFLYGIILLVAFSLYYAYSLRSSFRVYVLFIVSLVLGIGITSIQLIPSMQLFQYANRSPVESLYQFKNSLLEPIHFLRLLAPDFFGNPVSGHYSLNYIEGSGYFGIIPLFFVVYSVFFLWNKKIIRFFLLIILVGMLLSTKALGQYLTLANIQLLTYGAGYRIFSLVYLPASILAGMGLWDYVGKKSKGRETVVLILLAFICLIFFASIFVFDIQISDSQKLYSSLIYPAIFVLFFIFSTTIFFIFRKKKIAATLFVLILIGITFFDLFRTGYRFLTYSSQQFLYPPTETTQFILEKTSTSLGRVYGLTEPEIASVFKISTPEIYNPIHLSSSRKLMDDLLERSEDFPTQTNSYSLSNHFGEPLKRTMDFLGVEYVVVGTDHNPSIDYFKTDKFESVYNPYVFRGDRFDIFRNKDAHPRFGLFYNILPVNTDSQAMSLLKGESIDLQKSIILESPVFIPEIEGTGSAQVITYGNNTASFFVKTSQPAYFYLSDTYYPGWKVYVNEKEQTILKANYNFRAVEIPSGESVVRFEYLPSNFYLALSISLFSSLCLIILPLVIRRQKK